VERAMKLLRLAKRKREVGGARTAFPEEDKALFEKLAREEAEVSKKEKELAKKKNPEEDEKAAVKAERAKLEAEKAKGDTFDRTFALWRDTNASHSERLEAQNKLDAGQAAFKANEAKLKARREAADDRYRGIKADVDAQGSYYVIARDEIAKETEGRKKAAEQHAEDIKTKLQTLETDLHEPPSAPHPVHPHI